MLLVVKYADHKFSKPFKSYLGEGEVIFSLFTISLIVWLKKASTVVVMWWKLKKIHRVLISNQSQWLKPYVEFNTQKEIDAEINVDKDGRTLYKLMNNAVYSITMENLRNRIDVRLLTKKCLFKMDIRTKLHVTENISQSFSRDT